MKPDNFETKILDNASDMILALLAVERAMQLSNVEESDGYIDWMNASADATEAVGKILEKLRESGVIH